MSPSVRSGHSFVVSTRVSLHAIGVGAVAVGAIAIFRVLTDVCADSSGA